MKKHKVAIVGSGPAGYTAAIYTARAMLDTTLFAGRLPGGLLTKTSTVENFPGFPDGIEGFDLVMAMQEQAEKFGTDIEYDEVVSIDFQQSGPHRLTLSGGNVFEADAIILALGSSPRKLGIPAEDKFRCKGVSSCATCDGAFFKGNPVVVAGGGDSAMEEAVYLTRFASHVHVVHRRESFKASAVMVERAKNTPGITFHLNSVIKDICGNERVEKVIISDNNSGEETEIICSGVFCALGHIPNTQIVEGKIPLDQNKCIITDHPYTSTAIPGVFAAGDCADPLYRQAITAAGSGCRAAMDAIRYLEKC